MKEKYVLNIDRLEVCFTASIAVTEELINTTYMEREDYRLTSIESENKEDLLQVDIRERI